MPSEKRLWQALRALKGYGVHVRRQYPISGYYLDFYCAKAKLALELDGKSHDFSGDRDAQRDAVLLKAYGITTLRVDALSVQDSAEGIAMWFFNECKARTPG